MIVSPRDAQASDTLRRARTLVLRALAIEVALLAATGLWLVYNYRPSGAALAGGTGALRHASVSIFSVRGGHRIIGRLAVLTSVGAGVLVFADAIVHGVGRRRVALLVIAPALVVTVLAASFTGYLLPWDQLAMWAVKGHTAMRGFGPAFDAQTRFVLMDNVEISKAALWRWFIIHTVGVAVVLVGLVAAATRLKPTVGDRTPVTQAGPGDSR